MSAHETRRVEILYPGSFFPEEDYLPAEATTTPEEVVASLPAGAYAFKFQTLLSHDPIPDGRGGTLDVRAKVVSESGWYYPDGEVFTVEQIAELPGDHRILISNLSQYENRSGIRTRRGNRQPLLPGDTVIPTGGAS